MKEELRKLELSNGIINKIEEFFKIDGTTDEKLEKLEQLGFNSYIFKEGLQELKEVVKYVRLFNVEEKNFTVDLTIARGLDYYTGTVYETNLVGYESIGSICSGGRYENLASYYTKKNLPGVGISIGLTRLFYNLKELGLLNTTKKSISKVGIIPMGSEFEEAVNISNLLRENNIPNEIYKEDSKIKNKFSYANNLDIPYVIIIGQEEKEKGMFTIKNMITGDQNMLSASDILKILK